MSGTSPSRPACATVASTLWIRSSRQTPKVTKMGMGAENTDTTAVAR